ncbi:MAG: hypothetical protein RL662_504 [Bacteroidota bacterium]|jgi:1,4-alpha-glucan branching enzyme
MKRLIQLVLVLVLPFVIQAQIVTTTPAFLNENSTAEIIFDASSTALNNYTKDDVYAHTGVITDKSTSNADWKYTPTWLDNAAKYKLTSLGNNKWKLAINPNIRTYYGVPGGEIVKKLALVFRNGDGSKEGKDNGKDILIDVLEDGLSIRFETPTSNQLLDKNTTLSIKANSSQASPIRILLNDAVLSTINNATSLSYSYTFANEGNYWLIAEAGTAPNLAKDSIYINIKGEQVSLPLPQGVKAGVNYINDNTATFVLYAPLKENVYLIGDFNDWRINNNYMLNKAGDYWWITLDKLEKGKEYAFQYLINGSLKIADPYTDKVLDPWNDPYIPNTVYPNLKKYPTGKTEGITSVVQTAQSTYSWKVTNYKLPAKDKMVIYELLIRDFTKEHSFASTMQKLDYLQALGINAIELMPINEFEGNSSWGYNPSFYFAVDKYYGTKDAFKSFVDECHKRGMAVIIDMVLNHSFGQSPFAQLYWDSANNRPASNNPWYNAQSPNQAYQWGSDFNHESEQTKTLVDSINSYWMSEYKIDGFRFDFTKGFTNTPGDGWKFDQARINLLKRMTTEIYKRNPNAIVIMEHLAENEEEKVLSDANIMLWGNINNNYCEAIMGYTENNKTDLSSALHAKRGWSKPNLIAYMESHDEERMMYKTKMWGKEANGYSAKDMPTALKRAELSAAFYLTLPGPKMIWQFGELGYDYSINTCSDRITIAEPCRVAEKPIKWEYFDNTERRQLYTNYSKLINLKTENQVFESQDITYSLTGGSKYIVWKSADMNAFAIGNFDTKEATISVTLPKTGIWYNALTGEAKDMVNTNYSEVLKAGEYRIYIDNKEISSIEEDLLTANTGIKIEDNKIEYMGENQPRSMTIYDLSGGLLTSRSNTKTIDITHLPKGYYIVKVQMADKVNAHKFMKK